MNEPNTHNPLPAAADSHPPCAREPERSGFGAARGGGNPVIDQIINIDGEGLTVNNANCFHEGQMVDICGGGPDFPLRGSFTVSRVGLDHNEGNTICVSGDKLPSVGVGDIVVHTPHSMLDIPYYNVGVGGLDFKGNYILNYPMNQ